MLLKHYLLLYIKWFNSRSRSLCCLLLSSHLSTSSPPLENVFSLEIMMNNKCHLYCFTFRENYVGILDSSFAYLKAKKKVWNRLSRKVINYKIFSSTVLDTATVVLLRLLYYIQFWDHGKRDRTRNTDDRYKFPFRWNKKFESEKFLKCRKTFWML